MKLISFSKNGRKIIELYPYLLNPGPQRGFLLRGNTICFMENQEKFTWP